MSEYISLYKNGFNCDYKNYDKRLYIDLKLLKDEEINKIFLYIQTYDNILERSVNIIECIENDDKLEVIECIYNNIDTKYRDQVWNLFISQYIPLYDSRGINIVSLYLLYKKLNKLFQSYKLSDLIISDFNKMKTTGYIFNLYRKYKNLIPEEPHQEVFNLFKDILIRNEINNIIKLQQDYWRDRIFKLISKKYSL